MQEWVHSIPSQAQAALQQIRGQYASTGDHAEVITTALYRLPNSMRAGCCRASIKHQWLWAQVIAMPGRILPQSITP